MQRYLDFISAGASDYPIEVLKRAGVDMTTSEPFAKTMAAMNRTMDEIEAILARATGALDDTAVTECLSDGSTARMKRLTKKIIGVVLVILGLLGPVHGR